MLKTWVRDGYEVQECYFDHDLHSFAVIKNGKKIGQITPDSIQSMNDIIRDLDAGEDVNGWCDGNGGTISVHQEFYKESTKILKEHGFDINFMLDHESLDFMGYEIEPNEPIVIHGEEEFLFRLDIDKETGKAGVYVAFLDDFDIGEDYTEFFDLEWLLEKVKRVVAEFGVENSAEHYLEMTRQMI